ncbi:TFIIB-type zinc finger domain-containing protein [Halocynthiibacter sp.]|uniref:TFIIB-type zinc finger domain-containing protein n=1 Tax=Halocynthiibacter sp. TaxID=1979210 RepID=UPI003C5381AB
MSDISETHRFPCDACGSDLRFDPAAGLLTCDHCGNQESMEGHGEISHSEAIRELDFRAALDARLPEADTEEIRASSCTNCGAQVVFSDQNHAQECPFCATPVVTDTGASRQIKPKATLPFALEEREAHDEMNAWLGKLWFAPGGLQEYARKGRKMNGIYVPYWTYDADTKTRYSGQRGTVYYETRTVRVNGETQTRRVQKIRWRNVSGRVARFFDDVLVLASHSLPKKYTDNLAPWNLSHLEPYRPEYLAGFNSEGYVVELADGYSEARAMMDQVIRRDIKFDIGGDRQRISAMDTSVSDVTFKHILLPVWMAAYKYRGKTYRFVVNGQTGRVQGERPWSAWKIAAAVILGLIVAGGIGYLIAQNQ